MYNCFKGFPILFDEGYCFLDNICGDKCMDYSECECDNTTFDFRDNLYCCIPKDKNCNIQGM